VHQTPYRFFSRTLDPVQYEADLNKYAASSTLKVSFRDERRIFKVIVQPTVVAIWEQ
jgi:hypothetical protein